MIDQRTRYFVGLDMVDPLAIRPRPCDGAVMDPDLRCQFFQWDYRTDGAGIIPQTAASRSFVLAIDGPQGLARFPEARARQCEHAIQSRNRVGVPARTPYALPATRMPKSFADFVEGSVVLFYQLVTSGDFHLLGMNGVQQEKANLLEVYPGAAWKSMAGRAVLPKKTNRAGRKARHDLLSAQGVQFPDSGLPTHDQLDAAMAAWTAYRFAAGHATQMGDAPTLDPEHGVVREGYIVQPIIAASLTP